MGAVGISKRNLSLRNISNNNQEMSNPHASQKQESQVFPAPSESFENIIGGMDKGFVPPPPVAAIVVLVLLVAVDGIITIIHVKTLMTLT